MQPRLVLENSIQRIDGPLVFARRSVNVGLQTAVRVEGSDGRQRIGRIVSLDEEAMVIEVLESSRGLGANDTRIIVHGEPLCFALGPGLLGRVFNSVGQPIDGGPTLAAQRSPRIDGESINPAARIMPRDFIETGVTTIDLLNSVVRGQKLPIFSASGLPHDRLAVEIAQRARLRGGDQGSFALVFAGIGISHDTAEYFRSTLESAGALRHTVMFLNLASDPSTQRLLTPRYALTAAEHLAFVEGRHVLVLMTDMTNYCEALREVSSSHGEIPSRKGYPGYMYSDLASIFERAGCLRGHAGTLTQLPILTMPGDDIGHPIPDLTGYITEGQIVLDRELDRRGIYPPVKVLPSLSRLMNAGIGEHTTHADHGGEASQLFAAYARATRVRLLASVMGRDDLSEVERKYLELGDAFEERLVHQEQGRTLEESMSVGWEILRLLPAAELTRLSRAQVARYIEKPRGE